MTVKQERVMTEEKMLSVIRTYGDIVLHDEETYLFFHPISKTPGRPEYTDPEYIGSAAEVLLILESWMLHTVNEIEEE